MSPEALRRLARGLRALRGEAKEIAGLNLSDAEHVEAERALQRKAHVFVDEMVEAGAIQDVEPEQFRRVLKASLVAEASVHVCYRPAPRRVAAGRSRGASRAPR